MQSKTDHVSNTALLAIALLLVISGCSTRFAVQPDETDFLRIISSSAFPVYRCTTFEIRGDGSVSSTDSALDTEGPNPDTSRRKVYSFKKATLPSSDIATLFQSLVDAGLFDFRSKKMPVIVDVAPGGLLATFDEHKTSLNWVPEQISAILSSFRKQAESKMRETVEPDAPANGPGDGER